MMSTRSLSGLISLTEKQVWGTVGMATRRERVICQHWLVPVRLTFEGREAIFQGELRECDHHWVQSIIQSTFLTAYYVPGPVLALGIQ